MAELKEVADDALPDMMNHGADENEKLRAELDAIKAEIQLRVDRIQELKESRTELHCSKVEKVSRVLSALQSSVWICSSNLDACV